VYQPPVAALEWPDPSLAIAFGALFVSFAMLLLTAQSVSAIVQLLLIFLDAESTRETSQDVALSSYM